MDSPKVAAAYIRVSTDDQTEFSPDAQRRALDRYAREHGYYLDPAYVYVDPGVTGRSTAKRPAFNQMIADAKQPPRPFDVILVHKFDRFARSREDSIIYKSLLKKRCGIRVVSITESIEDEKLSILIEAILEATAEFYSINLGDEVKKGMTEKARRGGLQCSAMFGYRVENNVLVPHPDEAPLIREIFTRFVDGDAYYAIATWLNSLGVKTKHGNPFENRTVEYILRNPAYIGKLRWNPSGRTRRHYDDDNLIVADAQHPPIVTQELWDAAQSRVAEIKARWKYHSRPSCEHKDWISGLIRCSSCGATLIRNGNNYLACNNYARGRCRTSQRITSERAKDMLLSGLAYDMQPDTSLRYVAVQGASGSAAKVQSLKALLAASDTRLSRARDAYLNGVDTLEEYNEAKRLLQQQREQIQRELDGLSQPTTDAEALPAIKRGIAGLLDTLRNPSLDMQTKHTAAHNLIHSITFDRTAGTMLFQYYYTPDV